MKFQLKALVAALALVAAVPAQAAIDSTVTGNGSLVLTVFDSANNISALFDLGLNYSNLSLTGTSFPASNALTANYAWDLTANGLNNGVQGDYAAAWSNFTATANEAGASWAVVAADNLGAGAGSRGFISTIADAAAAPIALTSNATVAIAGNLALYTDAVGVAPVQNHSTALNGASVSLINTNGYYLPYYNANKNNNAGAIATGLINSSLSVVQRTNGASGIAQSTQTIFGNGAKFTLTSAGQLSYTTIAAVPEADTWAMMLLGLGFMGFVARRKQA